MRHPRHRGGDADGVWSRRRLLGVAGAVALAAPRGAPAQDNPLRFGLTPVFLSNDVQLLADLKTYITQATGAPVTLVMRRTYQEITALLVSGRLDAAWICGYPFVAYRDRLSLVAVPVWQGDSLYQSYLIGRAGRVAGAVDTLRGDVHAFSDPDSNSGYLVTRALLAARGTDPETFFRRTFFTYGHRNVIRAVAAGLADSGSVDGYVLEVLGDVEPGLARGVTVVHRSEWLGFPPVACPAAARDSAPVKRLTDALLGMDRHPLGQKVLGSLRLDGFAARPATLYDTIAAKVEQAGLAG
ncbi:PhnD/SsuA/transferrin family substrate-binding protein [Roseospira navarrensis]|uniref:PhnD/SsuA/transferrin family substrate-binding protein n=1 Tax=Roseospira navarrensis TaxID=140058 RepID=A0A7X1ZGJ3_9PROT|nr:PhnD/SsuA/transferrin family substrate-binding protein [Roseospira navarrensis]MQX38126.1 PhnD/SsuA/transferrin family substrate-binding protein [Roseospira navarrensis]